MYADYNYYTTQYGGKMSATDYAAFGERATDYIASVTFDRVTGAVLADATTGPIVKTCCCAIADAICAGGTISSKTSEKVGDYSVSYDADAGSKLDSRLYRIASMYLSRYGLMYRGCD